MPSTLSLTTTTDTLEGELYDEDQEREDWENRGDEVIQEESERGYPHE